MSLLIIFFFHTGILGEWKQVVVRVHDECFKGGTSMSAAIDVGRSVFDMQSSFFIYKNLLV